MSRSAVRLFDAHCHLQDRRVHGVARQLIGAAMDAGVRHFVVNGVSEGDWHLVKQMAGEHPSVLPSFGLHPWYVGERSPRWLETLKGFFESTPEAAVGEIGLDKGAHGKQIDFRDQVLVFEQQLELAKTLERPVSVHCAHWAVSIWRDSSLIFRVSRDGSCFRQIGCIFLLFGISSFFKASEGEEDAHLCRYRQIESCWSPTHLMHYQDWTWILSCLFLGMLRLQLNQSCPRNFITIPPTYDAS